MTKSRKRVILIVIDGFGVGEHPDAKTFYPEDIGSDTFAHVVQRNHGVHLPTLRLLGLENLLNDNHYHLGDNDLSPIGCFGKIAEQSAGKDTSSGHWEMMGVAVDTPFRVYKHGFPDEIIIPFCEKIGVKKVLGNTPASGTAIIEELGDEHIKTGNPIVYTSADSVFQIACHEDIVPPERLYQWCKIALQIITPFNVCRVIARPFIGKPKSFTRTFNRHDFSLPPKRPTLLHFLQKNGITVHGVGKIPDIFAHTNLDYEYAVGSNENCLKKTLELIQNAEGFIFTNLVETDSHFGHRNDPIGYAKALEYIDTQMKNIITELQNDDLLIITSDHGCDPTTSHTDHSREYVPLLVYGKFIKRGVNLGIRTTLADIGQTVADYYHIAPIVSGKSFLNDITIQG